MSRCCSRTSRVIDQFVPRSACDRLKSQRPITKHITPATSGPVRSEYSANQNAGDATQIRGTKNPTHARTKRRVSSGVLWLLATLTLRLRWPCGARMAIITAVAASTIAFAIHGFIANHPFLSPSRLRRQQGHLSGQPISMPALHISLRIYNLDNLGIYAPAAYFPETNMCNWFGPRLFYRISRVQLGN